MNIFIALALCTSFNPGKIYYNSDRVHSLFKQKYVKASEVESIDGPANFKFQDTEDGKRVIREFDACSITIKGQRFYTEESCEYVAKKINGTAE